MASFVCLLMHVLLMGVKRAKSGFPHNSGFLPDSATTGGRRYPRWAPLPSVGRRYPVCVGAVGVAVFYVSLCFRCGVAMLLCGPSRCPNTTVGRSPMKFSDAVIEIDGVLIPVRRARSPTARW